MDAIMKKLVRKLTELGVVIIVCILIIVFI